MAKNKKQQNPENGTATTSQPQAAWVDNIRVHLTDQGNLKALISVRLFEAVYLTGLRVVSTNRGVFVAMPSRKTSAGEYQDIYFPASKEWRDSLSAVVLEAYHKEMPQAAA